MKARRKKLGLSQDAVARSIGVDRVALLQWESGKHAPHWVTFQKWESVLQSHENPAASGIPGHSDHPCHKLREEIIRRYAEADADKRDWIEATLRALAPETAPDLIRHLKQNCDSRQAKRGDAHAKRRAA